MPPSFDPKKYVKDPKELLEGLKLLRNDLVEINATEMPDNPGFFWKLVHLQPAVYRGLVLAIVLILGGFGLVATGNQTDAIVTVVGAVAALIQAFWTRSAVVPLTKVVVYKPDPVGQPTVVAPGEAVSTNLPAVVVAAQQNSVHPDGIIDLPPIGDVLQ